MEVGVRLDAGGIEATAALGDNCVELGQAGDMSVDDWLVHQGPEPLGGLQFRTVGRQEGEADPVGDGKTLRPVPTGVVEGEDDAALAPGAGVAGEGGEASSSAKKDLERPLERYQTVSPVLGGTKAMTWSHW
jgi:hypothetical protein